MVQIPLSPLVRILLVEDFEPFRRFIRSQLEAKLDFEVIAEVSDGLEAVQKGRELQPDLILLDIGLPRLNGIEAARRIRKLSPLPRDPSNYLGDGCGIGGSILWPAEK